MRKIKKMKKTETSYIRQRKKCLSEIYKQKKVSLWEKLRGNLLSEMGEQVTNSRAETDPELRRKINESGKIIGYIIIYNNTIRMLNITPLLLTEWSSS